MLQMAEFRLIFFRRLQDKWVSHAGLRKKGGSSDNRLQGFHKELLYVSLKKKYLVHDLLPIRYFARNFSLWEIGVCISGLGICVLISHSSALWMVSLQ
jgi:hypothetical protein